MKAGFGALRVTAAEFSRENRRVWAAAGKDAGFSCPGRAQQGCSSPQGIIGCVGLRNSRGGSANWIPGQQEWPCEAEEC